MSEYWVLVGTNEPAPFDAEAPEVTGDDEADLKAEQEFQAKQMEWLEKVRQMNPGVWYPIEAETEKEARVKALDLVQITTGDWQVWESLTKEAYDERQAFVAAECSRIREKFQRLARELDIKAGRASSSPDPDSGGAS